MDATEYKQRRKILSEKIGRGIILLATNKHLPRNYPGNVLPFRQDSSFLYYTGLESPGLFCIIDCDSGEEILFGNEPTIEDTIWSGSMESLSELARNSAIQNNRSIEELAAYLSLNVKKSRPVHYLPPYTSNRLNELSTLLNKNSDLVTKEVSDDLKRAVVEQRIYKTEKEIQEIENALDSATGPMHIKAMQLAKAGVYEFEIVAELFRLAKKKNLEMAYPVICSVRGEILHNESHANILKTGQLLLIDAGAESRLHYASDITRTVPVDGIFSSRQKEIYEIVLTAQLQAINSIKPDVTYREIHISAALNMAEGLKEIGLMKGNMEEAVEAGAHALFFPHGLGHMLGLDVHDMEDLGENLVGYADAVERSKQFGTAYLRLARKLQPGFVLTVEPGIYFIPNLIHQWETEQKFHAFIAYNRVKEYIDFGGIRIEDNVLVTSSGARVLGKAIPKAVDEIERLQ
jgi:Xaa-Pro dipeptidase